MISFKKKAKTQCFPYLNKTVFDMRIVKQMLISCKYWFEWIYSSIGEIETKEVKNEEEKNHQTFFDSFKRQTIFPIVDFYYVCFSRYFFVSWMLTN